MIIMLFKASELVLFVFQVQPFYSSKKMQEVS